MQVRIADQLGPAKPKGEGCRSRQNVGPPAYRYPLPNTDSPLQPPSRRSDTRILGASAPFLSPLIFPRSSRRQSKHIGRASCSGLVQSIFSPPARPSSFFFVLQFPVAAPPG